MRTRRHTESTEMIADIANFKKRGVTEFLCNTYYIDKKGREKRLAPVMKTTAYGISSYANAMWRKYGDTVTVEVVYFDFSGDEAELKTYCTYHA